MFKIGDRARVIGGTSHNFPIGTEVVVNAVDGWCIVCRGSGQFEFTQYMRPEYLQLITRTPQPTKSKPKKLPELF